MSNTTNNQHDQHDEQRKQKARERVTRWRLANPERARVLQLRHFRNALRQAGFVITGGNIDLDEPKGGADRGE